MEDKTVKELMAILDHVEYLLKEILKEVRKRGESNG